MRHRYITGQIEKSREKELRKGVIMKKVKILLTIVLLSLIMGISGCGGSLKTPPWSESDIEQMENEKVECVPIVRYEF